MSLEHSRPSETKASNSLEGDHLKDARRTDTSTSGFLDGYQLEDDWCAEVGVSTRTCQRYRLNESPGLPYVELGGKIYIKIDDGRQWLANRTRRRNTVAA